MVGKVANQEEEVEGEGPDKEPPLVVIEEGSEEHKAAQRAAEEDRDEDEEGGEEAADERLGSGREPTEGRQLYGRRREGETDEQYKERRRQERKQKKTNQRMARQRLDTELRYLDQRNSQLEVQNIELNKRLRALEQGQGQNQAMLVDNRLETLKGQLAEADRLLAAAVEAQNGEDVVQCNRIRDVLNRQIGQLESYREHLARGGQATQQRKDGSEQEEEQQRPQVRKQADPKIVANSRAFQEAVPWFDPRGRDPESAMVYAIDKTLSNDSRFDPRTKKYWDELERRVKAAMPHKFEDDGYEEEDEREEEEQEEPAPRRAAGPRMPGGNRGRVAGNNTFVLSKERKEALIEAGVWDDPKLRTKYINRYREFDKANEASSRR